MPLDPIMKSWSSQQMQDALALDASSDIATVVPLTEQHYRVALDCSGLVRARGSEPREYDHWEVQIYFPDDYLRRFDPAEVLQLFEPFAVFHPNVKFPFVCLGAMSPGTGIVSLIAQLHMIISYQHMNLKDPLNPEAAAWARNNLSRFPIDRRPIHWREGRTVALNGGSL